MILNAVYENMLKDGVSEEIIAEFARISPISWVHMVFLKLMHISKAISTHHKEQG